MKTIISRLTMKQTSRVGFIDIVNGDYVRYWIDKYGDEYLAVSKYGFRVKLDK